ncbi:Thylakoid lumenal protein TL20.3, chloroplastic-like protein, partial [Drosera capensis]
WELPPSGRLKLKVDVSLRTPGVTSFGAVVPDHRDHMILAGGRQMNLVLEPAVGEVIAIRLGLELVKFAGMERIMFDSDCLEIVRMIVGGVGTPTVLHMSWLPVRLNVLCCRIVFCQFHSNLTNAVLVRSVLTRSDLAGAVIEGADFSDAVLDLSEKQVISSRTTWHVLSMKKMKISTHCKFLESFGKVYIDKGEVVCAAQNGQLAVVNPDVSIVKYANGTNPVTGVSTRVSLGCRNKRQNAYGSPSSPLLSVLPQRLLDRDGFCDESTGLCDAK